MKAAQNDEDNDFCIIDSHNDEMGDVTIGDCSHGSEIQPDPANHEVPYPCPSLCAILFVRC